MLIGYNKLGEIKFYFTDEDYLKKQYPNNTAKVSNFWRNMDHGLTELFVDIKYIKDGIRTYKVVEGKLIKKTEEELVSKNVTNDRPIVRELKPKRIEVRPETLQGYDKKINWSDLNTQKRNL